MEKKKEQQNKPNIENKYSKQMNKNKNSATQREI